MRDPQRSRELAATIGRRVLPELSKAFAYRASRFEGFKIACYQASDRGFFRAHRDNLSPATAHRRFALTLNLNDGYQGGQLRFPEYGPELYRPAAGAALLFSCSHLHEVLEVTAGRRFVLSFLFGEEPPARSEASGAPRAAPDVPGGRGPGWPVPDQQRQRPRPAACSTIPHRLPARGRSAPHPGRLAHRPVRDAGRAVEAVGAVRPVPTAEDRARQDEQRGPSRRGRSEGSGGDG